MINLKKNVVKIFKNICHKIVLRRDFMINRLEKNVDNNYGEFGVVLIT